MLLHLARKAFWPGKLPFPLLHIDTTWKFRDMIAFRDRTVREFGLDLIVHTNHQGVARGINPIDFPPSVYTDVMKTQALRQALDAGALRCGLWRRAARRGSLAGQGARVLVSQRGPPLGSAPTTAGDVATTERSARTRRRRRVSSRSPIGPRRTCGVTSPASSSTWCRSTFR